MRRVVAWMSGTIVYGRCLELESSFTASAADEDAGRENEQASKNNLKDRRGDWRVHEPIADPGDGAQLHQDHAYRNGRGGFESRNQIGHGVSQSTQSGHQP